MPDHSPAAGRGRNTEPAKGRLRIAVPAWTWGAPLFRGGRSDDLVSREEMMKIFGKELQAPALIPRRPRESTG
jgi:hypothetical protein